MRSFARFKALRKAFAESRGASWEPLGASFELSWTLLGDLMEPLGVILAIFEPKLLKTLKGSSKIKLFV